MLFKQFAHKLPPRVYAHLLSDPKQVICIKRGESGFFPIATLATPEALNSALSPCPTAAQIEAMMVGSMFGWDVPGANPDNSIGIPSAKACVPV